MSDAKRSTKEIELEEQKLASEIDLNKKKKKQVETETRLTELEVLEYERQERNTKSKSSEARVYHFVDQVSTNTVKSAIGTLNEWVLRSSEPITVVFNSPGGGVFPGLALYDAIKAIRHRDHVKVDTVTLGMAASMGGVLFQAGETRTIGENSYILIHEVSDLAIGTTSELEDELKLTKRLQARLLGILSERSSMSKTSIEKKWKKFDWWLDSAESVELGFADVILAANDEASAG